MHVFFTTVVRGASIEDGGEVVKLDWRQKSVIHRVPIVPSDPQIHDPNPRGSSRGGRGILARGERLYVANYHSLLAFDFDLHYEGRITHNLLAGAHEVSQTEDLIWVAATSIDAALGLDETGTLCDSWWPRENEFLQNYLSVEPLQIDKKVDNRLKFLEDKFLGKSHLHLNAIAFRDHHLYGLLNRYGIVYNATTDKIFIEDNALIGAHNLVFTEKFLLINDTIGRKINIYAHDGEYVKQIDLLKFDKISDIYHSMGYESMKPTVLLSRLKQKLTGQKILSRPLFVRGLCTLDNSNQVLVGFSPATIVALDIETEQLLGLFQYSTDRTVCIHGLFAWHSG